MPECPPSSPEEGSFWPVSCLEMVRLGDAALKVFYFRKEAVELWAAMSKLQGPALSIFGAPGIGKSCEVWAWISHMNKFHNDLPSDDDEFALWIQMQGNFPVVCAVLTKKSIHHVRVDPDSAKKIINTTRARYVVLDGIRNNISFAAGLQICTMMVKQRVPECKVFLVRSMGVDDSFEDYQANNVEPFEVYPWRIEQYLEAYANTDFQLSVKKYLDAGSAGSDSSDMSPIHKKYYYAGSSARWMFSSTLDVVLSSTSFYVDKISNYSDFVQGKLGLICPASSNHLLMRNKSARGDEQGFLVSKHVTSIVLDRGSLDIYRVCYSLASVQGNPSFLGWIVELDFISQLKACSQKSPASMTLFQRGSCDVAWPVQGVIAFDPDKILQIPLNVWLQPVKWNQEGFDLACVVNEGVESKTYLRYVQVTNAVTHKANIHYLSHIASEFARILDIKEGLGVEYVVVYPNREIPPTISVVPGLGHLSHLNVGMSTQKWPQGNEVSEIKVLSFEPRKQ